MRPIFAAILADIRPLDLNTHNITFNYSDNDVSYSLDVNGRFQPEQSAAALAQMVEVRDYSNEDYAEDTDGFDAMENLEDISAESLEEIPDKPEEIPSNLSTINRPADAMAFFEYYDGATNEGACTVSADMSLSESNIPICLSGLMAHGTGFFLRYTVGRQLFEHCIYQLERRRNKPV